MPREHLCSEAPPGSSPLQQLHALVGMHARIRLGRPTLVSELCVWESDLLDAVPGAAMDGYDSKLSPSIDCAVINWEGDAGMGTYMLGSRIDGSLWRSKQPTAVPYQYGDASFSCCGRWCITSSRLEGQTTHVANIFDVQRQRWLPQLTLTREAANYLAGSVMLTDSTEPLLAAVCSRHQGQPCLAVFGVAHRTVTLVRLRESEVTDVMWAPRTHCLVVLGQGRLAWLDMHPRPCDPAQLHMTNLPGGPVSEVLCMAASPAGGTLWVMQVLKSEPGELRLTAFSLPGLRCVGTWRRQFTVTQGAGRRDFPCALRVSYGLLAVNLHQTGTCVCQVEQPTSLGQLLFRVDAVQTWGCADGVLLTGILSCSDKTYHVAVLDARTGCFLWTGRPVSSSIDFQAEGEARTCSVTWGQHDPSQLHVRSVTIDDPERRLIFCVLQF